ncbi:MAG: archaeosortase/exosortase family protein [Sulfuriferula sp.]
MAQPQSYDEFLQKIHPVRHSASLLRFAGMFVVAFFLLQWGYQALSDTALYRFYLETLTVRPSAAMIQLIAPADGVGAEGQHLAWPGGRLSILNGCDGAEAMELLMAAFIAVAGSWRMRLSGIVFGSVLIYGLNQVRIVALYFAVRHDKSLFELNHGLVGPLIIIAVAWAVLRLVDRP